MKGYLIVLLGGIFGLLAGILMAYLFIKRKFYSNKNLMKGGDNGKHGREEDFKGGELRAAVEGNGESIIDVPTPSQYAERGDIQNRTSEIIEPVKQEPRRKIKLHSPSDVRLK